MRGLATLRAANAILAALMLALFLIHGVGNSFELIGVGTPTQAFLAYALLGVCCVHAIIGIVLTVRTLQAQREAHVSYPGANKRFWAVRISGLAIIPFVAVHLLTFMQISDGPLRLHVFEAMHLASQILLIVAIAVHVVCSARPLMVGLGVGAPRARAADAIVALAVTLLLMGIAFIIYYLRWSVV